MIDVTHHVTTEPTQVESADVFKANTETILANAASVYLDAEGPQDTPGKSKRPLPVSSTELPVEKFSTPCSTPKPQRDKRRKVEAYRSLTSVHLNSSNNNENKKEAAKKSPAPVDKDTTVSSGSNAGKKTTPATAPPLIPSMQLRIRSLSDITTSAVYTTEKPVVNKPKSEEQKPQKIVLELPSDLQDYQVNDAALETWRLAKTYRANQQRAYLRADVITQLLEHDCIPSCYLGVNTLPRFLLPLTDTMADTIKRHGREKADMAVEFLRNQCSTLKKRADNTLALLKTIYEEERDNSFSKAAELIKCMVFHYRGIEVKRLQANFKRELERRPTTNEQLGILMAKDLPPTVQIIPTPTQTIESVPASDRQRSPTPKRKRTNRQRRQSPAPRARNQNDRPRGRQQQQRRGGNRSPSPRRRNQQRRNNNNGRRNSGTRNYNDTRNLAAQIANLLRMAGSEE